MYYDVAIHDSFINISTLAIRCLISYENNQEILHTICPTLPPSFQVQKYLPRTFSDVIDYTDSAKDMS
jgi:hypothetical protein